MRKSKLLSSIIIGMLLLSSIVGCGTQTSADSNDSTSELVSSVVSSGVAEITVEYSTEDMDSSWDASSANMITLDGDSITVNGDGAAASGSVLTITSAGTYVLQGTLNDGQIIVNAGKDDTVRLVLNGVQIYCSDSAPIYAQQSEKTIVTLAEGSSNTLEDGIEYSCAEGEDEPNAVIFGKDDLTLNGSGSLTVNANFNNGIGSKADLVITGGEISVTAVNDALRGRDSIAINGGTFNIEAGGDGLQSNNDEDTDKGWISFDGGVFVITAGNDAIQAETALQVSDGEINLVTGGGSATSADSSGDPRSDWGQWVKPDSTNTSEEETASAKGIKAGSSILINGGVINIDSSDDAIHSNGDILIEAGELTISSGDDGVHTDSSLTVDGGTIDISQCYEGLESANITMNGGTVHLIASDDGLNAGGGNDGSSMGGRPGENSFSSDEDYYIRITGGYLYVDAYGDGIDSNGALYFDGGTVLVSGPTNNGNGPLDYNGTCEVTGGTLAIAGSSGMAQAPQETSTQNCLMVYYSSAQAVGTLVNLSDEKGNAILTFAPAKDYQCIVISSSDLEQGETYILSSGGTCSGEVNDGFYAGGTYSGGTVLSDITISSTSTGISDNGSEVTGGGGGMGGMDGQRLGSGGRMK